MYAYASTLMVCTLCNRRQDRVPNFTTYTYFQHNSTAIQTSEQLFAQKVTNLIRRNVIADNRTNEKGRKLIVKLTWVSR